MRKLFICWSLFFSFILPISVQAAPEKFVLDKEHTTILFFINHLGFSDKLGTFDDYDGYFIFDEEKPEESMVEVTIRPAGIDTDSKALDEKLQNKDWFNTDQYPEIHFKSSQIEVTGENTANVRGWLTMLGVKKSVVLQVTFNKAGKVHFANRYVAGFSARTEINRSDFGLNNSVPFVGENVRILIEAEGIKEEKE